MFMQVYHFLLDHRIGGPHIYAKSLVEYLHGEVKSSIFTTSKGVLTDFSLINLRHYWGPLYLLEVVLNIIYIVVRFLIGVHPRENTIFHVHGASNIAPLVAAWVLKMPVLWLIHDTSPRFKSAIRFGKFFMQGNHKVIAVVSIKSKFVYNLHDAEFLPAAVSPKYWSRESTISTSQDDTHIFFPKDSILKILSVGNLNPIKGFDVLLSSLEEFSMPFHLRIVGAELDTHRRYLSKLHNLAEKVISRNSKSTINFLGWQNKKNIRELLRSCDLFILPSLTEACPIALLEAVSMRCQCVATDVGDVRLIIGNAIGSQLVKEGDPVSLRLGIELALNAKKRGLVNNPGLNNKWHYESLKSATLLIYKRLLT